jgi:hypothetical protein
MKMRTAWAVLGMAAAFHCRAADLAIPTMGFVYDARHGAIRTIRGVPGAAVLDDSVEAGAPVAHAAVASGARAALAYVDGELRLIRLPGGETAPVAGAMKDARKIVWSPSGLFAALIGEGAELTSASSAAPEATKLVDRLPGAAAAVAVSDGGLALVAPGGDAADAVWLLGPAGPRQVAAPGSIVAAAFQPGAANAAAITRTGDLYRIDNADAGGAARLVFAGDARTAGAVAIWFAADGRRVYTANAAGTLAVVELATGAVTPVDCGCSPSALEPLGGELFRVTEAADGPLRIFDATLAAPRVWFVPQDAPVGERQGGRIR